jgi:reactive intermediate/imine deaminase
MRQLVTTTQAPAAIGSYSQAIRAGDTVYLSGQIPLDPATMTLVTGGIKAEATRVFDNMQAVATAAGGSFDDIVKLTVYLTHLPDLSVVNELMQDYFKQPFPARTSIQVSALPKGAAIEIEAILVLRSPVSSP